MSLIHDSHPPQAKPAKGERSPLLVLVHGRGSNEHDLPGLIPYLDERFFCVSVRAPFTLGPGAVTWYHLIQIGDPDPETFGQSLDRLSRFVDEAVAAYPVDPARVYLLGFSQGAVMSLALLLSVPVKLAGVVAMSGYVPLTVSNWEKRVAPPEALAGKAALVIHGTHDPLIPISYGRQAQGYLAKTPVALTYREYPMGHQISAESLATVADWLRAQLGGREDETADKRQ